MDAKRFRGAARRALLAGPLSLLLAFALLAPVACRPRGEVPGRSGPAESEWSWLQATEGRLDADRARLAALAAAALPAGAAGAGDQVGDQVNKEQLRRDVDQLAAEFGRRLVDYLNADPPVQGEPLSKRQRAALRMKSDEEIVQARAYIDEGGDYQRAIEIYEAALVVDPGNRRLAGALAAARSMRYMSGDRFGQVKNGMTPAEVRALLGQPNVHNVRTYPDKGVVAWFYPKDASGAAAAVWFHTERGAAGPTVYMLDFDAVQPTALPPEQAG